jgi:glycosyltransferase involved in cell wall biosynthesis
MAEHIRILVAGDPASIHTTRFVSLLQEIGYDVRIFQSEYRCWIDEHLHNTTIYVAGADSKSVNGNKIEVCTPFKMNCDDSIYRAYRVLKFPHKRFNILRPREKDLAKIIKSWNPDIVFSLKMQNDAYTVAAAKEMLGSSFKAKWVHFNWGSDIEFFGKDPDYAPQHLPKIKKVLTLCNYFIADCKRDVRQANEFGLKGVNLGDSLAFGGFDIGTLEEILSENAGSERKTILVKGRQGGYIGKAFNVLEALHRISNEIRDYKIKIILATPDTEGVARFLAKVDNVDYEIAERLPYRDLLALYAKSRIAISATDVDGTPSFLTEAMAMGAFPIHSDMESIREWVDDGVNGLLFPVDDIDKLVEQIRTAIKNDSLVNTARERNWQIVQEKMNRQKIRTHIKDIIENKVLVNS